MKQAPLSASPHSFSMYNGYAIILMTLAAIGFSLIPVGILPRLPVHDLTLHFSAYTVFALLATRGCNRLVTIVITTFTIICLGGLIELAQPLFQRDGSIDEFFANCLGVTTGTIISTTITYVQRWHHSRR